MMTTDDHPIIGEGRPRSDSISPVCSMANLTLLDTVPVGNKLVKEVEYVAEELQQEIVATNNDTEDETETEEENEADEPLFQQMMNRGAYLRQLRLLSMADEEERMAQKEEPKYDTGINSCDEKKEECTDLTFVPNDGNSNSCIPPTQDDFNTLPGTTDKVLNYNSYLRHQRYYDDYKHCNMMYIDFGIIRNVKGEDCGQLIIEQRKDLGKGGLCWDAGFMLGEFVVNRENEWNNIHGKMPSVVNLGSGTGLEGLMVAKAVKCHVEVTDLPELVELMADNVQRNFGNGVNLNDTDNDGDNIIVTATANDGKAKGTATSRVLRWGVKEDYQGAPYDVIIGADIVTSLYDPVALAQTLHALSGPNTCIYISGKSRLDKPHEEFDVAMSLLFDKVEKVTDLGSRLKSPGCFVYFIGGKR